MKINDRITKIVVGENKPDPFKYGGVYPPNVFLVSGKNKSVFIDTAHGKPEEIQKHLSVWESEGKPEIAGIILTHRHGDHIGGAAELSKHIGAPVISTAVEKAAIENESSAVVNITPGDGEILQLGNSTLEIIHTPGHTMGSLCVYLQEDKVLFTGDNILGLGTTVISPNEGDMASYIGSLQKMLNYNIETICPGHGPEIDTPNEKIHELIEHRHQRERQMLELITAGQDSMEHIFGAIYKDIHPGLHNTAKRQIQAHINKLINEKRIEQAGNNYRIVQ
ncbi:MAG: Glyoxylase, beta-lactamase superfamily II [Chloroflexi bacterium]|nr:MAG: Glyoxylase, beta-lactamase superfamily II [Chloroflexota bacterium]